jgi:hypothetical protein
VTGSLPPAPEAPPRRGLWQRWTALLQRREAGTALALFRIGCGLCVLAALGSAVLNGVVEDVWLDRSDGGYRTLDDPPWLFDLLGGVNPTTLWTVLGTALGAALFLTVGLGGRVTAFVLLQLYLAIANVNWDTRGCDDKLIENALWLLVLARATATLSLDCRLRTGRWWSDTPVPAWPRYLAIYQLVLVYWTTGLQKISIHWTPAGGFSALYYILQEPSWQRRDMSWLAWVYPLTQVATAVTWLWELSAPLLLLGLWYRHTRDRPGRLRAFFNWLDFRRLFVVVGVCMHLGVWVLIGLGPFTWISLSFYVCLFHPDEWRGAWQRIRRGARNREGEAPAEPLAPGSAGASPSPIGQGRPWLRRLIPVLLALHVLAITLMAIPAPAGAMDRADWKTPLVQDEFSAWAERLSSWGLAVTPAELEEALWDASQWFMKVRRKVLAPFQPYYRWCGTNQGWRMFVGPNLYPVRLHIDVEEAGRWRPVYVERDPEHTWFGRRLDHEHLRTAVFTMAFFRYDDRMTEFAHWVAVRAARDFPRADRVRVRVYQFRTRSPQEVREDRPTQGKFVLTRELELAPLRRQEPP